MSHWHPAFAQLLITEEQFHIGLVVGQYVLLPVILWLVRRAAHGLIDTAMDKVTEIADERAVARCSEVRSEVAGHFSNLNDRLDEHFEEDRRQFRELGQKLAG